MEFNLEIDRAVSEIKKAQAKVVCIQLPDGLKPKAGEIQKIIEAETGTQVIIWAGTCYGSCDMPVGLDKLGVDMLIHWGHSEWQ